MKSITEKFLATGRRKTAVARAILTSGDGTITINDRPLEEYFPTISLQNTVTAPFEVANSSKQNWNLKVRAHGGGTTGQIGAIRMAIARALLKADPDLRPTLKKEGLLTRDSRMKERKKPGQPGARKRFQFSKR